MRGRIRAIGIALLSVLATGGCLEPPGDELNPRRFFADPDVEPAMVPTVEEDPAFALNVPQFSTSAAYLQGYADGELIRYWNVDGPNATFIAPMFEIIGRDGKQIGRTIIDAIPGDGGYTPWWRRYEVHVTELYDSERIWSREAVDAAITLGLVEAPVPTNFVANCPVVLEGTAVQVSPNPADVLPSKWVWYKNRRVYWIDFEDETSVPPTAEKPDEFPTEMPIYPVYVLQRINQGAPIYEFVTGVDVDGDNILDNSNNIFAGGLDRPRYSPLWYVEIVRTTNDYISIDSPGTATVGLSAENQFFDPVPRRIISSQVTSVTALREALVNCPIQRLEGRL